MRLNEFITLRCEIVDACNVRQEAGLDEFSDVLVDEAF